MTRDPTVLAPRPENVPPELVRPFNYRVKELIDADVDPIAHVYGVMDRESWPELFWTPYNGGHWVVRRFEDLRDIMRSEHGTTFPAGIPRQPDKVYRLKPTELDPPEHHKFRAILGPLFTPKAIKAMEGRIREVTIDVIETFAAKGECEFVHDFAQRMPTRILMSVIGYPHDDASIDRFMPWVDAMFRGTMEERGQAALKIKAFVEDFVDRRHAEPTDDLISHMVHNVHFDEDGGRAMTCQEVIDMGYQLFLASLDTVPSTFVTAWRFLAQNPEVQQRMREHPEQADNIAEELMRITGVVSGYRHARSDFEFKGVTIRKDDSVLLPMAVANRDPGVFEQPIELVVGRKVNAHLTFGAGPHRCIGSHFARAEVRIVLEEWFKRIPSFRIKPNAKLRLDASATVTVLNLPLEWESVQ